MTTLMPAALALRPGVVVHERHDPDRRHAVDHVDHRPGHEWFIYWVGGTCSIVGGQHPYEEA